MTTLPKKSARPKRKPLDRARIELTALQLIERHGLADFSLRQLGKALGVEAMSLYHHFPSKAHLFDALLDRIVSETPPDDPQLEPLERLRIACYGYRSIAHKYPKFFSYMAVHRMNTRTALAYINRIAGIFRDAGVDDETAARAFRVAGYYLIGAGLEETSGYAKGPSAVEPVPDEIVSREFPHIASFARYFKASEFEATFQLGLDLLLAPLREVAARTSKAKQHSRKTSGRAQ